MTPLFSSFKILKTISKLFTFVISANFHFRLESIFFSFNFSCQPVSDFVFRIEDQSLDLFTALKEKGLPIEWDDKEINKIYNNRDHEGWENLTEEFKSVNPSLKKKMNTFCIKYGYGSIF